jgi:hypothetical protein
MVQSVSQLTNAAVGGSSAAQSRARTQLAAAVAAVGALSAARKAAQITAEQRGVTEEMSADVDSSDARGGTSTSRGGTAKVDEDDGDGGDKGGDMGAVVALMVMLHQHHFSKNSFSKNSFSKNSFIKNSGGGANESADAGPNAASVAALSFAGDGVHDAEDVAEDVQAQLEEGGSMLNRWWGGSKGWRGHTRRENAQGKKGNEGAHEQGAWTMAEAVADHSSDNYVALLCNHYLNEIRMQLQRRQQQHRDLLQQQQRQQRQQQHRDLLQQQLVRVCIMVERLSLHKPKRTGKNETVVEHYFEKDAPPPFRRYTTEAYLRSTALALKKPLKSARARGTPRGGRKHDPDHLLEVLVLELGKEERARRKLLTVAEASRQKGLVGITMEAASPSSSPSSSSPGSPTAGSKVTTPLVQQRLQQRGRLLHCPVGVPELSAKIRVIDPGCDVRIIEV